jgi:hypothetical protein
MLFVLWMNYNYIQSIAVWLTNHLRHSFCNGPLCAAAFWFANPPVPQWNCTAPSSSPAYCGALLSFFGSCSIYSNWHHIRWQPFLQEYNEPNHYSSIQITTNWAIRDWFSERVMVVKLILMQNLLPSGGTTLHKRMSAGECEMRPLEHVMSLGLDCYSFLFSSR